MSSDTINDEIVKKTQKILGKYVKKPVLTEKLLKKPPFRFLHDVIVAIISETGFLKRLFSDNELNSTSFTEKEAKIAFLNKLIEAVKTITKIDLKVRANKIVAGLEPVETNLLLQAIGTAVDKKISSVEYVESLKQGKGKKVEEKVNKSTKIEKEKSKNVVKRSSSKETPKSVDRSSNKESSRKKERVSKEKEKPKVSKEKKPSKKEEKTVESPKNVDSQLQKSEIKLETPKEQSPRPQQVPIEPQIEKPIEIEKIEPPEVIPRPSTSVRPKSARPKSGDRVPIKKPIEQNEDENLEPVEMKSVAPIPPPVRPKSSLRPPSVRPSSARPGAPRLRPDSALPVHEPIAMGNINVIIENMDAADEEETVIIQNVAENEEEATPVVNTDLNINLENKGYLVEQILEQIQENEGQKKVELDWEQSDLGNGSLKDVSQLRNFIQTLTKTANPLGKLLNYLHEDIDAMHNELQSWTTMKRQLFMEIERRNRMSAESDKPLLFQLEQLQQEIAKQEQEIATLRSGILKNEQRVKEILTK